MPTLTSGELQDFTDRIAALAALNIAGYDDELRSAANLSLADQALAFNSRRAIGRILGAAAAADEYALPQNYATNLGRVSGRFEGVIRALHDEAIAADGGAAADLRGWISALAATVHPLFAEAARKVYGEALFTDSGGAVSTVFAPNYQSRYPDRVFVGADGSLAEETTDATDVGAADVTLFGSDNHALYIGARHKFTGVVVALSTLGSATITPTWQYWNGVAWATLTVTDNSAGFTRNDTIEFAAPSDWERAYKDSGGTAFTGESTPLYWVRVARTADALVTPPVGSVIRIIPSPVLNSAGAHLGVDQPPLALCRISGTNAIAASIPATAIPHTRFLPPGCRLRALTPFSAALTPVASYVDQDGNNTTQAQSAWGGSLAAMDSVALTLAGGDTGVRAGRTTGWTVTTANTDGVFELYCVESRTPAL